MSHSEPKKTNAVHKGQAKQNEDVLLMQALAETNAVSAAGHSQDADRHHKVSHEKLSKQRDDFEHSKVNR